MSSHIATQEAVDAWKLAHRFVLDAYKLTNRLPREEHYGLIPKIRTSAVKIASNIVEGYARQSGSVYITHLNESQTALEETKYSLLVARDLGYISERAYDDMMIGAEDLGERLESLQQRLTSVEELPVQQPVAARQQIGDRQSALFGATKGVREVWSDFTTWLGGGKRVSGNNDTEGRVWSEDSPVRNYLEETEE